VENQDENFLEVRLDHTGAAYLKRLAVTTRWMFILSMLSVLLVIGIWESRRPPVSP
jgi:hypothetical protein